MFEGIYGYPDVKRILRDSLQSLRETGTGIHVLMVGPPASGKTIFLTDLERHRPRSAVFFSGGAGTKGGLERAVFKHPRHRDLILLVDELDAMKDPRDFKTLDDWMQRGELSKRTFWGVKRRKIDGVVIATANDDSKIPKNVRDRFLTVRLEPYSREKYEKTVAFVLVKHHRVRLPLALYIAHKMSPHTTSVRRAEDVARIAKTETHVDQLVQDMVRRGSFEEPIKA